MANRIDELIKNDRYLTPKEKEERQAIEDAKAELVEEVIEDEVSEESIPEEVAEDVVDEKAADLGTENLQTQGEEQSEIETDSVAPVEKKQPKSLHLTGRWDRLFIWMEQHLILQKSETTRFSC